MTLTVAPPTPASKTQPEAELFPLKPPLKWAGGKRWLVPHLRPLWEPQQHRRYVEPFCGGLATPLGLQPRQAWINDNNIHLVQFYRWVQRGFRVDLDLQNDREVYYRYRTLFNQYVHENRAHDKTASELFYYLNRTCYNGLCRFNRKGEFNVPFGSYKRINYLYDFSDYAQTMQPWKITSGDFEQMQLHPDDFIYADPPYDVPFVQYSQYGFNWDDQVRLAKWLARHPGPTVISNQATARVLDLYRQLGFETICLPAPRRISCNGDRTPATEVLAFRNLK